MGELNISAIILTYNEEIHIERCINSLKHVCRDIFIVDSFSTDNTCKIGTELGAQVYKHKWENNHSKQLNWGLSNLPIETEWILKMDADEYLSLELIEEIKKRIPIVPEEINGITMQCFRIFMGKEIKHGIIPLILLRLFKYKKAICEDKLMDEHIQVEGKIINFNSPFYDHNLKELTWWTNKHNGYATREAIELLNSEYNFTSLKSKNIQNIGAHSSNVRKIKNRYIKFPMFWRAFIYFCYRYFFRCGFLDGKEGFLWHFLQGFWYRVLADAKAYEIKKKCNFNKEEIYTYIKKYLDYNP
jgi:glycosyltransferase involved in cell wall biosynthesis